MAEAIWESAMSGETGIEGTKLAHIRRGRLDTDLRRSLQKLWDSRAFTDITIKVGEREFLSHKFLLTTHLSYFRDFPDLEIQARASVKLDPDVFQLVLTYLYLGELEIPLDHVHALVEAADFLGFDSLRTECEQVLLSDQLVHPSTCLHLLSAAYHNGNEELCTRAMAVALEHFPRLQHESSFRQLAPGCLIKYLSHPALKVFSPEDRLNALLVWVREDTETRAIHLLSFLDRLSLAKINTWFLEQVMDDPLIKDNRDLVMKLQTAMKEDKQRCPEQCLRNEDKNNESTNMTGEKPSDKADTKSKTTCLLTIEAQANYPYLKTFKAVSLDKNPKLIDLGKIRPNENISSAKFCTYGDNILIAGLGKNKNEVWKYKVSGSHVDAGLKLGTLKTYHHDLCMACYGGQLYIAGRYTGVLPAWSTEAIEIWDIETGSSYIVSCPDSNTENVDLELLEKNYTCCILSNKLIVAVHSKYKQEQCGWLRNKTTYKTKSMLFVFSLAGKNITHRIPLWDAQIKIKCMLSAGNKLILVSTANQIAVTNFDDIIDGKATPKRIIFARNFSIPNRSCAVILSKDGRYVMLYGGSGWDHKTHHDVYTASLDDIERNSSSGWRRVHSTWPLGNGDIKTYCTILIDI